MRDSLRPPAGHAPSWRDRLVAHFRRRDWRGFVRLYDLLKPIGDRRQLRVASRYGAQFFLVPWDSVDTHVLCEGFYESEVLEAVRPALAQPGAVLWVVGANFGLHAITAKYLHPAATVVAFEPSPAMGARVIENCELNGVKLDLHAYALADTSGALPFYANASGNPGMSTLHPVAHLPYDHRFYVATLTAAQVIGLGLAPPPTAMIVDAEGAEIEVLRGMGAHLNAPALKVLVFEAENNFLERRAPADLYAIASGAGFELQKLERRERTEHNLSNFTATRP